MRPTFPATCPYTGPGPSSTLVGCLLQRALAEGVLSCLGGPGKGGGGLEVTVCLPGKRMHGRGGIPFSLQLLAHPVPHLVPCPPLVPPVPHEDH